MVGVEAMVLREKAQPGPSPRPECRADFEESGTMVPSLFPRRWRSLLARWCGCGVGQVVRWVVAAGNHPCSHRTAKQNRARERLPSQRAGRTSCHP